MSDRNEKLTQYWMPEADITESRKQGSTTLSYVSHVHTQRALDQIDPDWKLDLVVDANHVPVIAVRKYSGNRGDGTTLTLWGTMTLLGATRWCVGSVDGGKADAEKELIGDLIRNGAMRHGVFAGLWAKEMPGRPTESHAQRPTPPSGGQTTRQTTPPTVGIVSDWSDDPLEQAAWTMEHVQRTAQLLHSNPDKILNRLLSGLADKGHDTSNGWQSVDPDEWVKAVLSFEGWAERKNNERADS